MNIQIFGRKKSKDTKKAERFFSDRRIKFHSVNLDEKEMSKGEFERVKSALGGAEGMIDKDSKQFKKKFQYMEYDVEEELVEDQSLLKLPIVRNGGKATIGYDPDAWLEWINKEK
ncbi:MAG: ArsC family transcriptional regulator [Candidatus Delongbacteria bacterium]|jgi:arsenate reductase|nr:ArsC family transcriptional regulator [Candidatus Delongbacteria bacterium]